MDSRKFLILEILGKKENRDKLPFEIDGIVVIVNDDKVF